MSEDTDPFWIEVDLLSSDCRRVMVESGCFVMAGGRGHAPSATDHRLVGAHLGYGLLVFTRIHLGTVKVSVERHEQAPPVSTDGWDAVAEISVDVTEPEVARFGEAVGPAGPGLVYADRLGRHRLRVYASGQDYDDRQGLMHSPEHYLIQAWPSTAPAAAAP